jgi:hypothetical protein
MSDPAAPPAGLVGAPLAADLERLQKAQELALGAVPYVGLLIAIFGTALLLMLLAPQRQRRAVDRLRSAPVTSFLVGVVLWSLPALVLTALLVHSGDRQRGQLLLGLWVFFSGCAGYAVCARALGERLLPDHGAVAHTLLGLAALVLPLFSLIGLPVLLIGAPLGLGAWVTARRQPPVTAEPTVA